MAYLVLIDLIIIGTLVFITNPLITLLRRNDELFPTRASLSRPDIPAGSWPQRKIPRILHQTCANDTIPEKWVNSQRSCKEAYSEYEYKVCFTWESVTTCLIYLTLPISLYCPSPSPLTHLI